MLQLGAREDHVILNNRHITVINGSGWLFVRLTKKMPQAISKCRYPLNGLVAIPNTGCNTRKKKRTPQKKKRSREKKDCNNVMPKACTVSAQPEDWEREIEEFMHTMQEEKEENIKNRNPYDAEDALNMAACDMSLYMSRVPESPQYLHYFPSAHHKPPVEWTHHVYTVVKDQFADAEE